jgi:hypothetical protein
MRGGSPSGGTSRTSLTLEAVFAPSESATRQARLTAGFIGPTIPEEFICATRVPGVGGSDETPAKRYRNPVLVAREWRQLLDDQGLNRAQLARRLGITRARVTQTLRLLDLTPPVVEAVAALGEPQSKPVVTERSLRTLIGLPAAQQEDRLAQLIARRVVANR